MYQLLRWLAEAFVSRVRDLSRALAVDRMADSVPYPVDGEI
jgi:hypothetical protein